MSKQELWERYMVNMHGWTLVDMKTPTLEYNNKKIEEIDLDTSRGLWECVLRVLWPTGCYGMDHENNFSVGRFFTYDKEDWSQLMEMVTEETVRSSVDFMKPARGPEIIERYMSMRFLYL